MAYDDHTWAHTPSDIPEGEHFAIIEFGSIWVPGDERSRTAPGHGYPEHTESKVDYIVFKTREAWEAEIKFRMNPRMGAVRTDWVPVHVRRAQVKTTVTVETKVGDPC